MAPAAIAFCAPFMLGTSAEYPRYCVARHDGEIIAFGGGARLHQGMAAGSIDVGIYQYRKPV